MKVPKPFGFPLVVGRVKKRLAKKICQRRWHKRFDERDMWKRLHQMEKLKIGDLVQDCSGFNDRIVSVEPVYKYTKHGAILIDLDFKLEQMSCSMYHCGVDHPLTYEEAESNLGYFRRKDPGAWWSRVTLNPDGTYKRPDPI